MPYILYSIIALPCNPEGSIPLPAICGVNDSELLNVSCKGMVAVLEEMSQSKVIISTEKAMQYAKIIEELHQQYDLLPVRYGTVMDTIEAVVLLLDKYQAEFERNLKKVENKEEFSLKIFWDYEKGSEGVRKNMNDRGPEVVSPLTEKAETAAYLFKKIKAYRFENALLDYSEQICEEIRRVTRPFCPEIKFKKMPSKSTLLEAYFLQKKGQKENFIGAVQRINDQYTGFRFLLTGPWPPYNFVTLDLKYNGQQ
jgi:hypothetical protein